MMRSMYSAVSGLRVHQGKMDTIGNNIANVNTVGFKRGQVTFQEVFSQVVGGASAPQGGKGGTNPQQIGMGVTTGSINTIHTQGPGQRTDNATDLMIEGEGFFVITSDPNLNNKYYTRAGNFTLDAAGNLVTANGDKVLGYGVDNEGNVTSDITNIRINMSETQAPTATKDVIFKGNLDSRAEEGDKELIDTVIHDSLGNSYKVTFEFVKDNGNGWDYKVKRVTDLSNNNYVDADDHGGALAGVTLAGTGAGKLTFNNNGKLTTAITDDITFKISDTIEFTHNKEGKVIVDDPGSATPTPTPVRKTSGTFETIVLFDPENEETTKNITQYANEMNLKPYPQNGNVSGTLEGFTIDSQGIVLGVFSNDERRVLGQLMLAKFDNPMGLQKLGGNNFIDTRNSGQPQLGKASTGGLGAIRSGNLEMSNVDISLEFTEMITTQRGFQANSRIITTSDEMLQELVNMKR